MISKAKILFYGAYKSGKPPNDGLKPLNFIHKLMLLRVRRFRSYSEIPDRISYFDWDQSCVRAKSQRSKFYTFLAFYLVVDVALFIRRRTEKKADLEIQRRTANNIPLVPHVDVFGTNDYWFQHTIDYWLDKKMERKKREAEEREKLEETDAKTTPTS